LEKAYELDWEAALKATSWGRFQILGMHHERYGFETVGEFLRFISVSEANQLEGAFGFIRTDERLAQALRKHDWTFFSRMFYGMQPRYPAELAAAYQEAREQAATARDPPAPPHAFSPEASMVPPNR
jgi:hypothetical protein